MRFSFQLLLWLLLASFWGCHEAKVTTDEVSTEAPSGWPVRASSSETVDGPPHLGRAPEAVLSEGGDSSPMKPLPGLAEQTNRFQSPTWVVPVVWQPQPLGSMRKGSWRVEARGEVVEISVLAFPGAVGGLQANLNRWAGQVGASRIDQTELETLMQQNVVMVDGAEGIWVTLNGAQEKDIICVIVTRPEGTWFFKMQGDRLLVESQVESFTQFIASVHFQDASGS